MYFRIPLRITTILATAAATLALAIPAGASNVPRFYYLGFTNPQIRPTAVYWGAGGSLFVKGLNWHYWDNGSAYGRGTRYRNTCNPNCGAGNYLKSPASITFWRTRWHNGHRYYTRLTLRWHTRDGVHRKHIYRYDTDWP
ncbi:MAG: hypothetical protein ACTHPS_08930 [Streptosporangiaceae bacterium]